MTIPVRRWCTAGLVLYLILATAPHASFADSDGIQPSRVRIWAGELWDAAGPMRSNVDLWVENGRIVSSAPHMASAAPAGTHEYDFSQYTILPGGLATYEVPDAAGRGISPETKLWDSVDPSAADFKNAARLGATAVLLEGSPQTAVSGTTSVVRPLDYWSNRREIATVGISLYPNGRTAAPRQTSMEAAWTIRKYLLEVSHSKQASRGAFADIIAGKLTAQFRATTLAESARAINIAQEFRIFALLTNVQQIPEALRNESHVSVLMGPMRLADMKSLWRQYSRLLKEGISLGILTGDAVPLPLALALSKPCAIPLGISDEELLRAFTANPAKVTHAASIGTLSPGSSADFVVLAGRLFDSTATVEHVFIEAREVYNRASDRWRSLQ